MLRSIPCLFSSVLHFNPLHVAVSNADTQIVELLIEKGADTNYRDNDVSTKYIWS
jgi:ankyrin repeat protein